MNLISNFQTSFWICPWGGQQNDNSGGLVNLFSFRNDIDYGSSAKWQNVPRIFQKNSSAEDNAGREFGNIQIC